VNHWRALKWTPEHFREVYGDREVPSFDSRAFSGTVGEDGFMRDHIDSIRASTADNPARYVSTLPLHQIPELFSDVAPLHPYLTGNWLTSRLLPHMAIDLYIGGPGATLRAIHHERIHHHGFTSLVFGEKRFMLWSPSESPFMYPQSGLNRHKSSIEDPENPDFDKFPLFAKAEMSIADLRPGDTLFIPAGWWHTSRVVTMSINVTHCFANHTNWNELITGLTERIAIAGRKGALTPFTQAPNCCARVPAGVYLAQLIAVGQLKGLGASIPRPGRNRAIQPSA